jgi:CRISPR/Cas system CSM-associated protein Csm3 (group 7 of RAMP superfamily)
MFDDSGLPYISGRRLKGLLREAFRDVVSALGHPEQDGRTPAEQWLFGRIGDTRPGALRIGSAWLCRPESDEVDTGLRGWLKIKAVTDVIERHEVIDHFTDVRWQTRIDPRNGTAQRETLRTTRTLLAGLQFRAEIETDPRELPSDLERLLALSAAALQSLGTSRSRGLGQVECRVYRNGQDLTGPALEAFEAQGLAPPRLPEPTKAGTDPAQLAPASQGVHQLGYRVRLTEPAVLAGLEGDPNLIATFRYLPGSSVQGWLAWAYLKKHPLDDTFYQLFCRGRLRFLPAYPEGVHRDTGGAVRLHPVPLCLRKQKGDDDHYRNRAVSEGQESRKVTNRWTNLDQAYREGIMVEHEVATEMQYHHARPSQDRRVGRAVGSEQAKAYGLGGEASGAVFSYEQILPGQSFQGVVEGDREALSLIRSLFSSGSEHVRIGRSRSGQYGGEGVWEWLDDSSNPSSAEHMELSFGASEDECQEVAVTLLSPLLGCNDDGHAVPEFPVEALEQITGLRFDRPSMRGFTRTSWHGGYLTHQRLPRQQMPALEAGSVFVLKLLAPVPVAQIRHAAAAVAGCGLGLRTSQGYGRLALSPTEVLVEDGAVETAEIPTATTGPLVPTDSTCGRLAVAVMKRRVEQLSIDEAVYLAGKTKTHDGQKPTISKSLLFRLLESLRTASSLDQLDRQLGKYRKPACDQMERCLVEELPLERRSHAGGPLTLQEFLGKVAGAFVTHYRALASQNYNRDNWKQIFGPSNPLVNLPKTDSTPERLIRRMLEHYLKMLAWKIRQSSGGSR